MRTFSPKDQDAERDDAGHRTGIKLLLRQKTPMSADGWQRWGHRARQYVGRSRYVYRHYSSTKQIGLSNGVPVDIMATDKAMGTWLIDTFLLSAGEEYVVFGWTVAKTRTHVKLISLFHIIVQDPDKHQFQITQAGRLSRYFFRRRKT